MTRTCGHVSDMVVENMNTNNYDRNNDKYHNIEYDHIITMTIRMAMATMRMIMTTNTLKQSIYIYDDKNDRCSAAFAAQANFRASCRACSSCVKYR